MLIGYLFPPTILLLQYRAAFTSKTKVVILNTPHNPSGKCFTREELIRVGEICAKHNVLILADEVVGTALGEKALLPSIQFG